MISYVLGLDVELVTSCFLSLFKASRIHSQKKTAGEKKRFFLRLFEDVFSLRLSLYVYVHTITHEFSISIERKRKPWSWARNNNLIRIVVCSTKLFLPSKVSQARKKIGKSKKKNPFYPILSLYICPPLGFPPLFLRSCSDGEKFIVTCQDRRWMPSEFFPIFSIVSLPQEENIDFESWGVDNFLKVPRETWGRRVYITHSKREEEWRKNWMRWALT